MPSLENDKKSLNDLKGYKKSTFSTKTVMQKTAAVSVILCDTEVMFRYSVLHHIYRYQILITTVMIDILGEKVI